jgi:peptidoglycan/xylan/chitin deacetylase (PgdA/CDA1 family)
MGMRRSGADFLSATLAAASGGVIIIMTATLLSSAPAHAQQCPGNPDAIGTSRVLTLQPGEVARVGTMQYPQTLPLADHEVVLTFDDGPLPRYSNPILDTLASQCVKATYFIIGEMAHEYPDVVRRMYAEGHTIGTHSETHPLRFGKLPIERMRAEIDNGIANVAAALGDPTDLAPFFRVPGLESSETLESELRARGLVTFSADAVADDWHRRIKPDQIISRAISRLEARGKGILLLHDIHPATVAALPGLFKQLKDHGFRIVQVVPARLSAPELLARATAPMVALTMAEQDVADDSAPTWPRADDAAPKAIALAAPDDESSAVTYALTPAISSGDIEDGAQMAGAASGATPRTEPLSPALPAPWPEPSMENVGLPVGRPIAAITTSDRTVTEVKGAGKHVRLGHALLRPHRHARAPAPVKHHADLVSALAALAAPARNAPKATHNF